MVNQDPSKTKAPNAGPGALANLFLSLELSRSSYQDLFSDLSITPKDQRSIKENNRACGASASSFVLLPFVRSAAIPSSEEDIFAFADDPQCC